MIDKEIYEVETTNGLKQFICLDIGNGWQTMLKSEYDEMIAAQSTPIDTEDE